MKTKEIKAGSDKYFSCTKNTIDKFGDVNVSYGVFLRHDVVVAAKKLVDFINENAPNASVTQHYADGTLVRSETKILSIEGPMGELVELETHFLQRIGLPSITAYNAYQMSKALPTVPFMDMAARHLSGPEQHDLAAYGASVGSKAAQEEGAKGFIGSSTDLTAHYYGSQFGMGTTPHAAIGYAAHSLKETPIDIIIKFANQNKWDVGTVSISEDLVSRYVQSNATAHSVEQFMMANPNSKTVVALVDYYGTEIDCAISAANKFKEIKTKEKEYKDHRFGVRLDTHGGRFAQGLSYDNSVTIVEDWVKRTTGVAVKGEFNLVRYIVGDTAFDLDTTNVLKDQMRKILFGQGVSAANIINMRNQLDLNGHEDAIIVASSGFNVQKCLIMATVKAPIDMVGTGSYLPETSKESYATADIFRYDGENQVKVGREWLYD